MGEYEVEVVRDPETGLYVGTIVELPGIEVQGADMDELKENLRKAVKAHHAGSDFQAES